MPDKSMKIGDRIHHLRIKKQLSLANLAKESGLSEATLAGIEDHSVLPPLGQIVTLAKIFQTSVGEIFGDSADSPFCIIRSDDHQAVSRFGSMAATSGGYSYESLGHQKQNRQMEPFLVTLTPVAEPDQVEPNQHDGEEFIFVLNGQVDVRLSDHKDVLNPGDSVYYDSALPHVVSCHGKDPATILAVIYAKKELLIF